MDTFVHKKIKNLKKRKGAKITDTKAVAKKLSKGKKQTEKRKPKELMVAPYIPNIQDVSPQEKLNLMMREEQIKKQQEDMKRQEELMKQQYNTSREMERIQLYSLYNNILQENKDRERSLMDLFRQQSQGGLFVQREPSVIYLPDKPSDRPLEQIEYNFPESIEQQFIESVMNPINQNQIIQEQNNNQSLGTKSFYDTYNKPSEIFFEYENPLLKDKQNSPLENVISKPKSSVDYVLEDVLEEDEEDEIEDEDEEYILPKKDNKPKLVIEEDSDEEYTIPIKKPNTQISTILEEDPDYENIMETLRVKYNNLEEGGTTKPRFGNIRFVIKKDSSKVFDKVRNRFVDRLSDKKYLAQKKQNVTTDFIEDPVEAYYYKNFKDK